MAFKIFLHGLESSNQGTKAVFFRERYPDMSTPNFRGSLQQRMEDLHKILAGKTNIGIVGSSFGGLMGAIFSMENASRVDRLILLAPAINFIEFTGYQETPISVPTWVFHGTQDEVIPIEEVEHVARRCFTRLHFNRVEDDHFLHNTFKSIDWDGIL
ncbi:MAG: YqiA/YcfP family alpha/beta fold hydrolase [Desulfatiglandales bacterium]